MKESPNIVSFQPSLPPWEALPTLPLYMDQVILMLETYLPDPISTAEGPCIRPTMINNYVKQRLLPPPEKKKYAREHLALLLMICIFKQALSLQDISRLLALLMKDGIAEGYRAFHASLSACFAPAHLEENLQEPLCHALTAVTHKMAFERAMAAHEE